MKKEIPILFSTPMVQAILDGRKTQTRRIITGKHLEVLNHIGKDDFNVLTCPKGVPGDLLWVREAYKLIGWDFEDAELTVEYRDGSKDVVVDTHEDPDWLIAQIDKLENKGIIIQSEIDDERFLFTDKPHPWIPSIHMPKFVSRIWLEIVSIKVERLQDISEDSAIKEGVELDSAGRYKNYLGPDIWGREFKCQSPSHSFKELWQKINGKESWDLNPWVWVIEFRKTNKNK